jgi:hypothetical protein
VTRRLALATATVVLLLAVAVGGMTASLLAMAAISAVVPPALAPILGFAAFMLVQAAAVWSASRLAFHGLVDRRGGRPPGGRRASLPTARLIRR